MATKLYELCAEVWKMAPGSRPSQFSQEYDGPWYSRESGTRYSDAEAEAMIRDSAFIWLLYRVQDFNADYLKFEPLRLWDDSLGDYSTRIDISCIEVNQFREDEYRWESKNKSLAVALLNAIKDCCEKNKVKNGK